MSDELRSELVAAYENYRNALRAMDSDAFLVASFFPPKLPRDVIMEQFEMFADDELESGPDLAEREFVAIKTAGDDQAAYYSVWRPEDEPGAAGQHDGLSEGGRRLEGRDWRLRDGLHAGAGRGPADGSDGDHRGRRGHEAPALRRK